MRDAAYLLTIVLMLVGFALSGVARFKSTYWPALVYSAGLACAAWSISMDPYLTTTGKWWGAGFVVGFGLFYVIVSWRIVRRKNCKKCKEEEHARQGEHEGQVDGGAPEEAGGAAQ